MPPCLLSLSAPHLASRPCFAMQAMPHSGPHLHAPCCPYLHLTSPCPHRCVLTTGSNAYLCSPLLLSCILATPCPCSHAVPSIDTAVAPFQSSCILAACFPFHTCPHAAPSAQCVSGTPSPHSPQTFTLTVPYHMHMPPCILLRPVAQPFISHTYPMPSSYYTIPCSFLASWSHLAQLFCHASVQHPSCVTPLYVLFIVHSSMWIICLPSFHYGPTFR